MLSQSPHKPEATGLGSSWLQRFRITSLLARDNAKVGESGWLLSISLVLLVAFACLPGMGLDLKYHWASSGLLAFWGSILASRLPTRWVLAGWLAWFLALGASTLLALWCGGLSDGFTLAGLFPFSDAAGYFADAQRILAGEPLTSFSSRRPLYASFLAGLLTLTGGNLRLTLGIQTGLVSAALAWTTWGFWRRTGSSLQAGVFGATLWLFQRRFIGTTTTENLGFLLGSLGFLSLWEAVHQRSSRLFLLGLFLVSLALNARAGAFFVLPALLVWGVRKWPEPGRAWSQRLLVQGGLILLLSFSVNFAVLLLSRGRPGAAYSNFSYTLYGLVFGGNWQLALQQHPDLVPLDPGRQADQVFHLALAQIQTYPMSLVKGALRAWAAFFPEAYRFADTPPRPWSPPWITGSALFLLALRGVAILWRIRLDRACGMLAISLLGVVLSVPFAPPWDSDYMRVYAATLPFLAWLAALGASPSLRTNDRHLEPELIRFRPLFLLLASLPLVVLLPHLQDGTKRSGHLQVIPGSLLHLHMRDGGEADFHPGLRRTWMNLLRKGQFPDLSLDQIISSAPPKVAPDVLNQHLRTLQKGSVTLALVAGSGWPDSPGFDTRLVVAHSGSAWIIETRGPRPPQPFPFTRLPREFDAAQ